MEKRCNLNVIGLGSAGCNIADKFARYPQYNIYKIDVELEGLKKDGIFSLQKYESAEDYERKCPSFRNFFKNVSGEVLVVVCGAGKVANASLRILENLKNCNVELLYIVPDLDLLGHSSATQNKIVYNVLQEYARSGLFINMFIIQNSVVQDIIGNVPIINYYDVLNESIVSTFHMMNVFRFSRPIIDTFSTQIESCRISTIGIFDDEENLEKLFFPLENTRELMYYYGVPREKLEKDGRLFRKITEQIKQKSTLKDDEVVSKKATFGIYQTEYDKNLNFVIASTSFIQK